MRICGPTKLLSGWLNQACKLSLYCLMLLYHSGMSEHLDCSLETAGAQNALGIWRINSGSVGFFGSTAGQLGLADPLFYRCLFVDVLRIDLADLLHARCILRIHCGQLDLAETLFYRCLFAYLLRIDGGPVERSGWFTVGPLDFEDLQRNTWGASLPLTHIGHAWHCLKFEIWRSK